jgi:uncharacterized protein YbbK (DUF523 family)
MYLAISGCLLGESIRYKGTHKRDPLIMDVLNHSATYVSCCPENLPLGTPRDFMKLVNSQKFLHPYPKELALRSYIRSGK